MCLIQQLTSSGELAYLGSSWRRDVAFAGYDVPLQGDIGAGEMIFGVRAHKRHSPKSSLNLSNVAEFHRNCSFLIFRCCRQVEGVDPDRRQRLITMLDIDLDWRLNTVSDGQRRRVQICMGLLKPYQVHTAADLILQC